MDLVINFINEQSANFNYADFNSSIIAIIITTMTKTVIIAINYEIIIIAAYFIK